ncbi:hypothetical protein BV20DRAFT_804890 [Pilatotrama ljubarskyi]|nr:hypothetical protein BV20DRAFT_804890 [Pilatotrama ljubarskyi]
MMQPSSLYCMWHPQSPVPSRRAHIASALLHAQRQRQQLVLVVIFVSGSLDGRSGAIARKGEDAYGGRPGGHDIAGGVDPADKSRAVRRLRTCAEGNDPARTAGRSPSSEECRAARQRRATQRTTRALRTGSNRQSGAADALRRGPCFAGSGSFIFAERSALAPGRRLDEKGSRVRGLDMSVRLLHGRSPLALATRSRHRVRSPDALP